MDNDQYVYTESSTMVIRLSWVQQAVVFVTVGFTYYLGLSVERGWANADLVP